jgi:hypothetical protein
MEITVLSVNLLVDTMLFCKCEFPKDEQEIRAIDENANCCRVSRKYIH